MATEAVKLTLTSVGAVRFGVRARPSARASEIVEVKEGLLVVRLAAPPVDGAANAELVVTLAAALGVAKRDVVLIRGESSRGKLVEVSGLTEDQVRERLARSMPKSRTI
jgi:uncharacterized protein (TIGR00251 family)